MAKLYMFCVVKSHVGIDKFVRALGTTRMSPIDGRLKKENQLMQARRAFRQIGKGCEGFYISSIADTKDYLTINDFYKVEKK